MITAPSCKGVVVINIEHNSSADTSEFIFIPVSIYSEREFDCSRVISAPTFFVDRFLVAVTNSSIKFSFSEDDKVAILAKALLFPNLSSICLISGWKITIKAKNPQDTTVSASQEIVSKPKSLDNIWTTITNTTPWNNWIVF